MTTPHTTTRRVGVALGAAATLIALPVAQQSASAASQDHAASTASTPTLPTSGNAIGWTAAVQHQTGPDDNRGELVMIAPTGGIVRVGQVSDDAHIIDVTLGGRYVITARSINTGRAQDDQTRVTVWDTHTKKPSYFRLSGTNYSIAFISTGIVVAPPSGKGITVRTYSGAVRTRFADVATASNLRDGVVASPDGRTLFQAAKQLYLRDAATGKVTKAVNPPAAGANGVCFPARSWTPGSFELVCSGTSLGDGRTYRVGSDGSLAPLVGTGEGSGGVWPTSAGVVAGIDGEVESGPYVLYAPKGKRTLPLAADAQLTGSRGPLLTVVSSSLNGGTVFTYDLNTGARRTLAGTATTGGGRYFDGVTIDGNQ